MNKVAEKRIAENKKSKSAYLDLGGLELTAIPAEIGEFAWLESLFLHNNQISQIQGLDKLVRLQTLYLHQNQIGQIQGLDKLVRLQTLYLFQNQIEAIQGLDKLASLKLLDLFQNKIEAIQGLDKLAKLQTLALSQNKIEAIQGLDKLVRLQTLDLSQNKIEAIQGLDKLVRLQTLYLFQNKIEAIQGLDKLASLKLLDLFQNKIEHIQGLDKLVSLQTLNLSQNKIGQIHGKRELASLQVLFLRENKIEAIQNLEQLQNLQLIELSGNPIKSLMPLEYFICNKNLPCFDENANIRWVNSPVKKENNVNISIEVANRVYYMDAQQGIYLANCSKLIEPAAEWLHMGSKAIKDYISAIGKQGPSTLNEAKVMVVGRPHAGKTTLVAKIKNADAPMPSSNASTRGIEVTDCEYVFENQNFVAHLWDFGGQDVQYAIHQFFMTQRAIYVLIDCTRDPEQNVPVLGETKGEIISNYWLQIIKNLANNSKTFYLFNLYGVYPVNYSLFNGFAGRYGFLHQNALQADLSKASPRNKGEIEYIKSEIKKAVFALPNVGIVLPKKWLAVRGKLLEKAKNAACMELGEYFGLAEQCGIKNKNIALLVSRYLHEIGTIVHYSNDKTDTLYNHIILQRAWATEATYKVVLDRQIKEKQNGYFYAADLERIWASETYNTKINLLLSLLKRFEICYEMERCKEKTFLIPQCLTEVPHKDKDKHLEGPVTIKYKYEFMPYGIVNRLAVRLNTFIDGNKVWKRGMVLKNKNGQVVVSEDKSNNAGYIVLVLSGDKKNRHDLQTRVMHEIDDLNKIFNIAGITSVMVPCICDACKTMGEPYLHSYKKLVGKLEYNKLEEECDKPPYHKVEILKLIDHAFFERPKEVGDSLNKLENIIKPTQSKIHIEKYVEGNYVENKIKGNDNAIVSESENSNVSQIGNDKDEPKKTTKKPPFLEPIHKRYLLASWALAAGISAAAWFVPLLKPISGLALLLLGGYGTYKALTRENKYMRLAKRVLWAGIGAAGVLNVSPLLSLAFRGCIHTTKGWLQVLGAFSLESSPLVTIAVLLLSFGFAGLLAYFSHKKEA